MAPKQMNQNEQTHPTSPWTECFEAAPTGSESESSDRRPSMPPAEDFECQKPPHDALSDVYNGGY